MNITLLTYDTLDSTNTEALKQARKGANEGLCIVARQQTAGRGRRGRTWVSEKNAGLYFSIILRPKIDPGFLPLITLTAGIAVRDTLSDIGLRPDIKWVNDVLVDEKKISGILSETTETERGLAVIVGIGINIRSSVFPPAIIDRTTFIEAVIGKAVTPDELIGPLASHLERYYDVLHGRSGAETIIDEWSKRSTYASGKAVNVTLENATITGVTDGLERNGALRVIRQDGSLAIIQTGDLEMLRNTDALPAPSD